MPTLKPPAGIVATINKINFVFKMHLCMLNRCEITYLEGVMEQGERGEGEGGGGFLVHWARPSALTLPR